MTRYYEIRVAGRFGAIRHMDWYSADVESTRRRLPVMLNLGEVTFMKPTCVIGTLMFMESMLARKRELLVKFPSDPGVLNYLVGIGFPAMMDSIGRVDWPDAFPREATKGLRPVVNVSRFSSSEEVERIGNQITEAFANELNGLGALLQPCYIVFTELADNVITHAGSAGYVLAQRFEYKHGPVIDLTVGDAGVGLRQSLARNESLLPQLTNDVEAIKLALQNGISGLGESGRGYGLGHVSEHLHGKQQWLTIRSGRAQGYWKEGEPVAVKACGSSAGTLVHAALPC